jgi:ribose-phosphate pyrophosphokinase
LDLGENSTTFLYFVLNQAMTTSSPPLVYALPSYAYLQASLCSQANFELGSLENKSFPDGERYLRVLDDVTGRDVLLVGGTIDDAATLFMYDLGCALVKYGARSLTLVIPYFGYSTMERAVKSGEVVVAKTRARLFSAIPPASYGNRIVLIDLHNEGITHYFEGCVTTFHLHTTQLILQAVKQMNLGEYVIGSTDAGRAKWVAHLANELGVDAAFVYKKRLDGETTAVTAVSARVDGKTVVIFDDMIRTGGSLLGAALAYKDGGAAQLAVISTHGLFPHESFAKLKQSGLFSHIICSNTHPRVYELENQGLDIMDITPTILPIIHQILW